MREILFRGKTIFNGTLNSDKWVESHSLFRESIAGTKLLFNKRWTYIYPITLGQYIGLKDKNGNKIFEGDIIGNYGIVRYCEKCKSIQIHWSENNKLTCHKCDGDFSFEEVDFDKEEIIGNIYDNPELIEEY